MFNAFLEPCYPCGISTNGNRVVAAVVLFGNDNADLIESHRFFNPAAVGGSANFWTIIGKADSPIG